MLLYPTPQLAHCGWKDWPMPDHVFRWRTGLDDIPDGYDHQMPQASIAAPTTPRLPEKQSYWLLES
jgi:hypothetical protein